MKRILLILILIAIVSLMQIAQAKPNLWQKTYGKSNDDEAKAITPTRDGGYIVAGWTSSFGKSDVYLIKIDKNGNKIW